MNNGNLRHVFPSCSFPKSMGELTIQKYYGTSIKKDLLFLGEELKELQLAFTDSLFSKIINDSLFCLNEINKDESEDSRYLAANIGNKIIGVCSYQRSFIDNAIYIYEIVIHPLISRLGGTLITGIVEESVKHNFSGRVALSSLEGSRSFYKRLGFIAVKSSNYFKLDPVTSDNWYLINGKYKLKDDVNFKK